MNVTLVIVVGYSIGLIGLGLFIGRWVRSSSDFFVAGRRLSPILLFATLLAANIGSGSTVGAAAIGYRNGLSAWWWVGSAGIGTIALAFWIGPRIWRQASRHDFHTVGDYLEHHHGHRVRGLVASLLWVATLFALAAQLLAVARILETVAGVPKPLGCLLGGLVMTSYFVAGGLLSSAWVNLVQLIVLMAGFALAVPIALSSVGGLGELLAKSASFASEDGGNFVSIWQPALGLRYVALLVPAFLVSPGILQKIYGARDVSTIRRAVAAAGVVLLFFAFAPPLLGMVARVHYPELSSAGLALPRVLMDTLPLWLGGLGLAAVFSAEVSSADAILFMLATSLSRDLYRRFYRPDASDSEVVAVARWAALAGAAAGVVLALVFETVIDALTVFYSILSVSLFVPVIAGLYRDRAPGHPPAGVRRQAMWAIVSGVLTLLLVLWATDGAGYGILNPTLVGLMVSGLAFGAAGLWSSRAA